MISVREKRIRKRKKRIAYFSMEIGIHPQIRTYSGGLGILAGDTVNSCADLGIPLVAVSLLYRDGYFYQKLDALGNQQELPYEWNPKKLLRLLKKQVTVTIENRTVYVRAWQYDVVGVTGYLLPVIFLDTNFEPNSEYDRSLSYSLYGGDKKCRFAQEAILGIGGVKMLKELGYCYLSRYHMNEGHASLLTLELLNQRKKNDELTWDIDGVKRMCVFTTHTPVAAGHDQFSYDLVEQVLGDFVPIDFLKIMGGEDNLNMTRLALNLSHYVNGVAKEHGKISREMFPGYAIDAITNGIHSFTWTSENFKKLYDQYVPGWRTDSFSLRYALSIPKEEIWNAHYQEKKALIDYVNAEINIAMDCNTLTIGFARRATAYKRADLVFFDSNRLLNIAQNVGKIQFIFAGKAHPQDWPGKELMKKIFSASSELKDNIKIVYLENYDMELAKMLIAGVDLWLNTPRKPKEASGTSGMKAAHNGIPSLSILDGWWIEGCIEGLTGWSIGSAHDAENVDERDANSLYEKLEKIIIPTFYSNRQSWIDIMRHCIAINASFFNTHRVAQQYVLNAYAY
ncbi:MAG: alpha-glucan family phosphorylase [Candidatus Omnitrophica bacterium]|nr:alpha-glucan family phosphorylase [Candidatus Omnitrophota bacterium]MBU1133734.1 alpha-glucan family phosphorylase [Candidatus Omnitrophota bacterium]MBU1811074.1 alpha-glucan family phosphorylase [Candidatus Omnitrophota bacterium]